MDTHRYQTQNAELRLPEEFRKELLSQADRRPVLRLMRKRRLHTVCEEAKCPNIGECFAHSTATFMILGDRCTRRCHFCAVHTGRPRKVDPAEAENVAIAAKEMGLDYVVVTSVDRDDLADCGADHFVHVIRRLKKEMPHATVEILTPDFKGRAELIKQVASCGVDVFGHNIETVPRLYRSLRPQSRFETSNGLLRQVASLGQVTVKSGMMVGVGETDEEVLETLHLLKDAGVQIVTIGQYLRPSVNHWPVHRYVESESYQRFQEAGRRLGFLHLFAGPFVRSSYHAKEAFRQAGSWTSSPERDLAC